MMNKSLAKNIAREHAEVRGTILDIRQEIRRLQSEAGPAHEVGNLRKLFASFAQHLKRHFELEEGGGFIGEYPEPGTQRVVKELLGQHRLFERDLDALLAAIVSSEEGKACLSDECAHELEAFLQRLEQHERAEIDLLQKTVYHETGGGN